jgi:hypothetical protein
LWIRDAQAAQAAIATGILGQVLLVVVLGIIKFRGRQDLRGDLSPPHLIQCLLISFQGALGGLPLLLVIDIIPERYWVPISLP